MSKIKKDTLTDFFVFLNCYVDLMKEGRRPSWDAYGMLLAFSASSRVVCKHHKVGCCIMAIDHSIISTGFNGPVRGDVHCDEVGCAKKDGVLQDDGTTKFMRCRGSHSEMNALNQTSDKDLLKGATIYLTLEPCFDCFKNLAQAGIKKVVYFREYRRVPDKDDHSEEHEDVMRLATHNGISVTKYRMPTLGGEKS